MPNSSKSKRHRCIARMIPFTVVVFTAMIDRAPAQTFSSMPLITIQGDNDDVCAGSPYLAESFMRTQICWVNRQDSIYTVYLKELSPHAGEKRIVARDTLPKSNPQIIAEERIAWQSRENDGWRIWCRNIENDSLGPPYMLAGSLENDPQITVGYFRIAWVDDGAIKVKNLFEDADVTAVDGPDCASPDLSYWDSRHHTQIVYEKGDSDCRKICLATLNTYADSEWKIDTLSSDACSLHPRFGLSDEIAYQIQMNGFWNGVYSDITGFGAMDTLQCSGFHILSPIVFTYPIPTSGISGETPFFVAFEKKPAEGDSSEIFIRTFGYEVESRCIEISMASGKNELPEIAYLDYPDSAEIAVFWTHEEKGKKDIWMAKSIFNPVRGHVGGSSPSARFFSLKQNHPNPFNSTTIIEFELAGPAHVLLDFFNVLGERIESLDLGFRKPGNHTISFNGASSAGGVYFYRLTAGGFSETKSMLLIR